MNKDEFRDQVAESDIEKIASPKAIKEHCKDDCMGGSYAAVKECEKRKCKLWPFRYGFDPFRKKQEIRTIIVTNLKNQKGIGETPGDNSQDGTKPRKRGNIPKNRLIVSESALGGINEKLDKIMEKLK